MHRAAGALAGRDAHVLARAVAGCGNGRIPGLGGADAAFPGLI